MIRNRSIRTKLTLLVLGPVLVMIVLAAGVVSPALTTLHDDERSSEIADVIEASMLYRDKLSLERYVSLEAMVTPEVALRLDGVRAETNGQRTVLRQLINSSSIYSEPASKPLLDGVLNALDGLDETRASMADDAMVSPVDLDQSFQALLVPQADVNALLRTAGDAELVRLGDAITTYYNAEDTLTDLSAFVGTRLGNEFDPATLRDAFALEQIEERDFEAFEIIGQPADVDLMLAALHSDEHEHFEELLDRVLDGESASVSTADWWAASSEVFDTVNVVEDLVFERFADRAAEAASEARSTAWIFGLAAAGASLLAVIAAFVMGRRLAGRLARLAIDAHAAAADRLPEALATVGDAHEDVAEHLPELDSDAEDEIGDLASSFNTVLRTAVETSVEHVQQRSAAMTNILLSLGRRNQSLIDRQLGVLDELEARVEDPAVLEGLFSVDHMLTRLRRNSENLLVLASERPARQWSTEVSLLDVVRGAGSEVEDLDRVNIDLGTVGTRPVPGGRAVDLSHIVAELIDNSLAYSPPSTQVALRATEQNGVVRLWVVDRGVGMTDEELLDVNTNLESPADVAGVVADQVGFQVIGRLAKRMEIAVAVQANPGGGTAASIDLGSDFFTQQSPAADPVVVPPVAEPSDTAPAPSAFDGLFTAPEPAPTVGSPDAVQPMTSPQGGAPVASAPSIPQAAPARGSEGFIKRVPGQSIASSATAAASVDAGTFRRLPTSELTPSGEDPEVVAEKRRAALSGLQSGVARGRTGEPQPAPTSDDPSTF